MLKNLKEMFSRGKPTKGEGRNNSPDDMSPKDETSAAAMPEIDVFQVAAAKAATIQLLTERIIIDAAVFAVLGGPPATQNQPDAVRLAMALQAKAGVLDKLTGSPELSVNLVRAVSGKLRGVGDEGIRFVRELLGDKNLAVALMSEGHDARSIFDMAKARYQQQLIADSNTIEQK